jgi:hypothetical protein
VCLYKEWIVGLGNEADDAVLLDDDVAAVGCDYQFDLDIYVVKHHQEVRAFSAHALVFAAGHEDALEALDSRALAHEFVRGITTETAADGCDVLIDLPEERLVLREPCVAALGHRRDVTAAMYRNALTNIVHPWR